MPDPVAVGVIGVGALGSHHARILATLPEARLVGLFDIVPEVARTAADRVGTRAFPSREALLSAVEAVTVAVPTVAHHEVGLAALHAGRHVLMEKPLAATVPEADELVEVSERCGRILQVGHVERFNRALRAAQPHLDAPRFIESHRLAPFQPRGTDVAVILDLMIHDLDLVLYLVGERPRDVRAVGVPVVTPHVDIVNARLEFPSGAVANVTASRVSMQRIRKLRIFQHTGYLSLDLGQGEGEFIRLKAPLPAPGRARGLEDLVEVERLSAPEADPLTLELVSFLAAVRGEARRAGVSGTAGREALALAHEVADAVGRSPLAAVRR